MKGSNTLMPTQLFGMAYLAYLVADNGIENVEELIEYVEKITCGAVIICKGSC